MAFYVDEHIKSTERVFPDQGRYGMLRYDMNENPEGLPAWFVDEVKAEITPEFLSIYPEPDRFLTKYAEYVGVPRDCVTATNGTDQAIRYLLQTFCGQGHEVVTVAPSFEMYWVNCNILGLTHVPVAYNDDLSFNMGNLIAAIGPNTDIVVLLNPNNPVGDAFTREDVVAAIEAARAVDAVVIIDEAYHYFYPNTFIDLTQTYDNVIVMRTFSKLFSLAACRLGVIISNPAIIHYVENAKLTFDVNALALLFGEKILDHPEIAEELMAKEREGRTWTIETLTERGYEARPSEGNFVFIRTHRPAPEVAADLEARGILVKSWNSGMLADFPSEAPGRHGALRAPASPVPRPGRTPQAKDQSCEESHHLRHVRSAAPRTREPAAPRQGARRLPHRGRHLVGLRQKPRQDQREAVADGPHRGREGHGHRRRGDSRGVLRPEDR